MDSRRTLKNKEVQVKRFKSRNASDLGFYETRAGIPYLRDKYQQEFDDICSNNPNSILEVGCGEGTQVSFLPDSLYVGVDLSHHRITLAKQTYPQKNFMVTDAVKLPFADEAFELVFCYGLLHHVSKIEIFGVIQEMIRVCKRGGRIVLMEPNAYSFFNWLLAIIRRPERGILYSKESFYRENVEKINKKEIICKYSLLRENTPFVLFQILYLLRNTSLGHSDSFMRLAHRWDSAVKRVIPKCFWQLLIIKLDKIC